MVQDINEKSSLTVKHRGGSIMLWACFAASGNRRWKDYDLCPKPLKNSQWCKLTVLTVSWSKEISVDFIFFCYQSQGAVHARHKSLRARSILSGRVGENPPKSNWKTLLLLKAIMSSLSRGALLNMPGVHQMFCPLTKVIFFIPR